MKIVHQYNYELLDKHKETVQGESLTVPNEAFSIKEIMERSMKGLNDPSLIRQEHYQDDSDFDDVDLEKISRLDLAEIEEYKLNLLYDEIQKIKKKSDKAEGTTKKTEAKKTDDVEEESQPEKKD